MKSNEISVDRLKEVAYYNPETGLFTRRQSRGGYLEGSVMGTKGSYYGYCHICIDRVVYKAHRLAFLFMTGRWPEGEIDHINGNRMDNTWNNLRETDRSSNARNCCLRQDNTSGVPGVGFHKRRGQWRARIGKKHLGWFPTKESAIAARKLAETGEGYSDRHGCEPSGYRNSFGGGA